MTVTASDVRSIGELLDLIGNGGRPEYLLFWGHRPAQADDTGQGCLSQWWPATFRVGELTYPSAEHFMMARKALLFGDAAMAEQIRLAPHPGAAKVLGRQVTGFDEQRWAERRFGIVVSANMAKFSQHADLRQFLLATGDRVLVEASRQDRVWGIGLTAGDDRVASPGKWRGLNLLGFALMEVRQRLRAEPVRNRIPPAPFDALTGTVGSHG